MNAKLNFLVEGNHNIPIALVHLENTVDGRLPASMGGYKDEKGIIHFDPNKVNYFVDGNSDYKYYEGVHKKVIKIETDEDLTDMRRRLLTLPLVFGVGIKEIRREGSNQVVTLMPFMVYINPSHPEINRQLQENFSNCEKSLAEGTAFTLEIRVGKQLKQWFSKRNRYASYYSYGSTICLTNFSRRCMMCYSPWAWVLPITWILGPPYLIYRSAICRDEKIELKGTVTLR